MKVEMNSIKYDINSTERKHLVLRGIDTGEYSFGLYSKWYLNHRNKTGESIPFSILENYVCGLIYRKENIDMKTASDIIFCQEHMNKKYGKTITEWFEDYLRNGIL